MAKFHVEYSSNNSGGSWWLNDADWMALQEEGWVIHWKKDEASIYKDSFLKADKDGRWLGALATAACKYFEAIDSDLAEDYAAAEFASITGQSRDERGCDCCGNPHSFYSYHDDCEWCKHE